MSKRKIYMIMKFTYHFSTYNRIYYVSIIDKLHFFKALGATLSSDEQI